MFNLCAVLFSSLCIHCYLYNFLYLAIQCLNLSVLLFFMKKHILKWIKTLSPDYFAQLEFVSECFKQAYLKGKNN